MPNRTPMLCPPVCRPCTSDSGGRLPVPWSAPARESTRRIIQAVLLAMAFVVAGVVQAAPSPIRVLFVGNSLTSTFDIPGTVQQLAASVGDPLICDSRTIPSSYLSNRATNEADLRAIDTGNYDFVVLQEHSSRPTIPDDRDGLMYPAVRTLNKHIVSHGARTLLYQTWAYPSGDWQHCKFYDTPARFNKCDFEGMTAALRMGYAEIANELETAISPVGQAWLTGRAERPDVDLYLPGDYHPSINGSYLSACVHYASITGRTPAGIPAIGQLTNVSTAAYLQDVAERTVFEDPWAVDAYGFASNRFYWAWSWDSYSNRTSAALAGVVISGAIGEASPSVQLNFNAGRTNGIYLGVYEPDRNAAGQGRLYVRDGGSIEVDRLAVGQAGHGWVRQDGGLVVVDKIMTLGEQPYSSGSYFLKGGELKAAQIVGGTGAGTFAFEGGRLAFRIFGRSNQSLELAQNGGVLVVTNPAYISGNYTMSQRAQLAVTLSDSSTCVTVAGEARLAGKLVVSIAPDLTPAVGQSFTLLSAQAVQGEWDEIHAPWLLAGGLRLVVLNQGTSVVAMVVDGRADSDGNGLPDWWELQYFGSARSGRAWTNSILHDGIPDGAKFALDVNPTMTVNLDSFTRPGTSNNFPTLTYRQLAGGTGTIGVDYTAMNVTYAVELKEGLFGGEWLSGTNVVAWTGDRVDNGDGTETVTVQGQTPINTSQLKILRLVIKRADAP